MKLVVKGLGEQEIRGLVPAGLPALRLVQYHSPDLLLGGYRLGDIELRPSLNTETVHVSNMDRAQLAALGKTGE